MRVILQDIYAPVLTLLTLLLMLPLQLSHAQDVHSPVAGAWEGTLKVPNGALRIVFHISTDEAGTLAATMDSPDQGATGIPVSKAGFADNRLQLEVAVIAGTYEGELADDGATIDGSWSQGGMSFPLSLARTSSPTKPNRPQEPQRPYPYDEEEVYFENTTDGVTLAGTLTLPPSPGPHPAVVLVSGSGAQDRDESLMGHRPFLVLADHLTRKGIAVLRYDDRGTAASTGNFATATTVDLARDAQAAVDFLKTREGIDMDHIGVAGHSEGGLIAPMLASKDEHVAFVVLLAGPGLPGREILKLQGELIARASGMSASLIEDMMRINVTLYDVAVDAPVDEVRQQLRDTLAALRADLDPATVTNLGLTPEREPQLIEQLASPWFRYFLKYDPAPVLQQVKVPLLSLIGSKDLQVPAEVNTEAIREALQEAASTQFEAQILPGLNHLFQTAETGVISEYGQIEETFSPDALNLISSWILDIVSN